MKLWDVWIESGSKGTQPYMGQVTGRDKRHAREVAARRWWVTRSSDFVLKEAAGYLTFEMLSQWKNHLVSMEARFTV